MRGVKEMNSGKRISTTAERLKQAIEEKNMRQADLARISEVDKGAISSYLSGKYEPKDKTTYKLAKALDVSEMWLWGYDVPKQRTQEQKNNDTLSDIVVRLRTDEDFFNVVNIINLLDDDKLKLAKQVLDAFEK